MKNTLSINTVGNGTQISLQKGNEVFYCDMPFAKHSETLFPMLEKFLADNHTRLDDLDCLGVVAGPGSFTGIRIGLSVVKTFAYVKSLPVVCVNALEIMASVGVSNTDKKKVCAVMFAGSGQVYYQSFEYKKGKLTPMIEPSVDMVAHFVSYIKSQNDMDMVVSVDDIDMDLEVTKVKFTPEALNNVVLAHQKVKDFLTPNEVQPLYLRLSQGEVCNVKLDKIDFADIRTSEITALCSMNVDKTSFVWGRSDWEHNILEPNVISKQIIFNGALIGAMSYKINMDSAELTYLLIDKKARNQGVAQFAIDYIVKSLKTMNIHVLLVKLDVSNLPLFNLLIKCGFTKYSDFGHKLSKTIALLKKDIL